MTQPGEHLDLVGLDLLAGAAPKPLPAPCELGVDRRPLDRAPPGRPVTIATSAGPWDSPAVGAEHHGGKPRAARITSTGAGSPVHRSNDAAP